MTRSSKEEDCRGLSIREEHREDIVDGGEQKQEPGANSGRSYRQRGGEVTAIRTLIRALECGGEILAQKFLI